MRRFTLIINPRPHVFLKFYLIKSVSAFVFFIFIKHHSGGTIDMKTIDDVLPLLKKIMKLVANTFGEDCEIVLHDWSKGYEQSIIAIENGNVTNRKVGNCGSNLGLEIMRGSIKDGDRFNYITKTSYGKILKSSTIYLTDDNKQPLGALCINLDITNYLNFQKSLESIIAVPENEKIEASTEFHAQDINQLSDFLLQKSLELVKKPVNKLTKDDKITIIRYLDEKGMFLITKSGDKVCQTLNISKFTLYNYLDIIRSEKEAEAD